VVEQRVASTDAGEPLTVELGVAAGFEVRR
jgi:hypothetical protein